MCTAIPKATLLQKLPKQCFFLNRVVLGFHSSFGMFVEHEIEQTGNFQELWQSHGGNTAQYQGHTRTTCMQIHIISEEFQLVPRLMELHQHLSHDERHFYKKYSFDQDWQ